MSWQLQLLNMQLRLLAKSKLAHTPDPDAARRDLDVSSRWVFRPPPFTRVIEGADGLHWISAGTCAPGRVILYLHGGGYVAGSPKTHAGMLARLSKLSGIEVCAPRYRLAQEAPFPAAFDDACAAWDRLRILGYAPAQIVLGGDSAGGGLALAVLARLCALGQAPAAGFAFSPWTDLAMTGTSLRDNARADPLLPVHRMAELVEIYLQGATRTDPRASPLYAEFPGCPPVLIQYSRTEILRDDTERMAERLRVFGADVTLQAEPTAPHVWQLFDGLIPEARASLRQVAGFVQDSLAATNR